MPYIVENSRGILINTDLYLSTETMNFGTQSDAASASNCDVYIEDGYWLQSGGGMIAQNFYLNRGFAPPCDRVTTVSGGTIKSYQTDIDDGDSLSGDVSQLTLTNKGLIRLVRINGTWVNMNLGQ